MNIVLLLAHSIEEHDQLKLLAGLGYDVFSIGGYIDPAHPHDDKRPALPEVPFHPELKAAVDELGTADNLDAAKRHIPDRILDWADVVIVHHYEHTWIVPEWERLREKRVIWRTVGQSVEHNERLMAPLHRQGLEIVRYSPKERNIPGYAGEDALIRFYKDPADWSGWTGEWPVVVNFTQGLAQREPYTNHRFWELATQGLPRMAFGPGSEAIGGPGGLPYDEMRATLRRARAYLYTGTQPASYTLGLIEAMMTGVPVVSIGPSWMKVFPYGHELFEGHELAWHDSDDPADANDILRRLLDDAELAEYAAEYSRETAIELFGWNTVSRAWRDYLGDPGQPVQRRAEAVAA